MKEFVPCEGKIDESRGYRIHVNLHKNCLSISQYNIDKKGWRVVKHMKEFIALNVSFKVSEVSRQRAIRENRRNVHAYAFAKQVLPITATDYLQKPNGDQPSVCSYNPYKHPYFYDIENGESVKEIGLGIFKGTKILYKR